MREQNPLEVTGSSPKRGVANLLGKVGGEVFLEYATDQKHQAKEKHFTGSLVSGFTEGQCSTAVGKICSHELGHSNHSIFSGNLGVRPTAPVPLGQ